MSKLVYKEEELSVDMCQAIQEMREESRQIGESIGEKRGERKGEKIGTLNKAREDARNFYKLGVDVEKVAQGVGYDIDTVKVWLGLSDD